MSDAVIVSTARTGLAKSWKGALNATHGASMGGHVVKAAADRATIERLGMLARDWARTAQGLAIDPATVPADIARSRDALQRELASQHDAMALAARLDRHLARCALPPRAPDAAAS